jgi:hypothetical protein
VKITHAAYLAYYKGKLMKALIFVLALFAGSAQAATISIREPAGVFAPVVVVLDGPGTIGWNAQAIAPGAYLLGPCSFDVRTIYTGASTKVGFTCTGPGEAHFQTTGQLTSTCPYDGGILESLHLTLKLDGAVIYDKQLQPNPVTCYVTPDPLAFASWAAPLVTFYNPAARPSASTSIYVRGVLYSQHVFTVPSGVACSKFLENIGTRFKKKIVETGFTCSAVVPANSTLTVLVQ